MKSRVPSAVASAPAVATSAPQAQRRLPSAAAPSIAALDAGATVPSGSPAPMARAVHRAMCAADPPAVEHVQAAPLAACTYRDWPDWSQLQQDAYRSLHPTGSWNPSAGFDPSEYRIMRRREVERVTGISRSSLYRLLSMGTFPRPVQLSPNTVGWLAIEVHGWLAERVAARGASRTASNPVGEKP